MAKRANWILMICAVLALSACVAVIGGQNIAPSGAVLFKDDFSNPKSGWDTWNETTGSQVTYTGGGLRFVVREAQFDYWSRTSGRYSDVRLEVDAIKLDGPDDNDFGLLCRYQNRNNFYAFLVSSDGYAGILKVKDGAYQLISADKMTYATSIHRGSANNRLQAVCLGSTLALFVNGQKVIHAVDVDFSAGEVGVMAGTNEQPGVDILFDNFVVYKP